MAELIDLRRDEAEVFRDERDGAEGFDEAGEELCAGALDPLAVDGGLFFGGDGPVGLEAAEVIETDDVVQAWARRMRSTHQSNCAGAAHPSDREDCPSAGRSG